MQNESTNGTDGHFQSSLSMVHSAHTTPQPNGTHLEKNRKKAERDRTPRSFRCAFMLPHSSGPLSARLCQSLFIIVFIIIYFWWHVSDSRVRQETKEKTIAQRFLLFRVGQFVFEFNSANFISGDQMRMTKEKKNGHCGGEKKLCAHREITVSSECDANVDNEKLYAMAYKLFLYIWLN